MMGEQKREGASGGPPAWLPGSVRAAVRSRTESDADLGSGAAWESLLETLGRAGEFVRSHDAAAEPTDLAAGFRHLLVLLALGVDEALRTSDPDDPHLRPGNVDAVLKWGMDCPDALYLGAPIRSDTGYRVRGRRGTVRYLGFQAMAGIESVANVVADDLDLGPDGEIDLVLSSDEPDGNADAHWMPLRDGASTLIVRQFFYDWEHEEPAQLTIERLNGAGDRSQATTRRERNGRSERAERLDPASMARQIVALGEFVDASVRFWNDVEEGGRTQGLNCFREPAARTDLGGAAENVTVWGSWQLDDGEALVIEVTPPEALYWSVALGDPWWESIDYANYQSSLNGHQAVIDSDGVFRAVVCHDDPGVANWLDPAGHRRGPMIFRWVRADDAPVPATRVVDVDDLEGILPDDTTRVDPATRQATIERRRTGVRRRFPR